jgi:tetratricopeptide (TPR) repeat protein
VIYWFGLLTCCYHDANIFLPLYLIVNLSTPQQVLHGFIRDCNHPDSKIKLDNNEPLYIIELGAGSGKFSYFMLKALEEMSAVCDFPLKKIVFVMTDFTENNFNFWRDHPSLKRYFDNGQLDAAIFDAVNDTEITLWKAGITLGPGSCKNPICVVANYLFDTLYHDIFQVDGGELKEGLISVGSKHAEEIDPLEPEIIQRMDNHFRYNTINPLTYYPSEEGDEDQFKMILKWYQDYYKNTASGASLLLPVGAMRALRRLGALSYNKALVISGDKGNNHPEQFTGLMDPHIALHGSFSLMVNYHAIGAWFTSKGGFALHNPQEEASLKVGCFVLDSSLRSPDDDQNLLGDLLEEKDTERSAKYPHLTRAFNDYVESFGPNDFFVLQKSMKEDTPNPPLRAIVALLKLGDYDPDVFFKFRDSILNQAPTCGAKLRNDLCRGIPRVWENYYVMDMEKDIAFEIGRFYYGIRDYANALHYYTISSNTIGLHHVTYHNQGLCHYSLGEFDLALTHFRKALALNASYDKARNWIEKVEKEMSLTLIDATANLDIQENKETVIDNAIVI